MATASEALETASNWLRSCRTGISVPKSGVTPQQAATPHAEAAAALSSEKSNTTHKVGGKGGPQSLDTTRVLALYTQRDINELKGNGAARKWKTLA